MRLGNTIMMAATICLALGLAARADEDEGGRRAPEAGAPERKRDEDASQRERQRDREAADNERRGDRDAGERERRRDEGRSESRAPLRGPVPPEESRRRITGGGRMGAMRMGMEGMMPGMMGPEGMMSGMRARMREADPEMFELEQNDERLDRESHELAEQYRRAPEGPARDELRAKLKETVARHYKARQERRQLEVKRLEAQLERLRSTLEKRSKDSDAIIEHRISQLLGEDDFGF